MGTLGRVFVLVNGMFALTFLMWSAALYTNRVNWFSEKAGAKENVGLVEKFSDRFKTSNANAIAGVNRYSRYYNGRSDITGLVALENDRFARRDFYRDNLNRVREGKDKSGKALATPQLVRVLDRDSGGIRFSLANRDYQKTSDGNFLDSIAGYNRKIADSRDKLTQQQKEVLRLVKVYEGLTLEIFGNETQKGLRTLIREQESISQSAVSATNFLIPQIAEREAQTGIFEERSTSLNDRFKLLEGYLKGR